MSDQSASTANLRLNRRRVLRGGLLAGGGAGLSGLLAACAGQPQQPASTPAPSTGEQARPAVTPTATAAAQASGQPEHGALAPTPRNRTVIIDQVLFHVFDSFNPFIPNGQQYQAGFQQTCKEFLFYANYAAGRIEPWLATGWKYNPDFTELTITLNPKARWNDGTPVTSRDLRFSIEMLKGNPTLLGGSDIRTFVESVSNPDDRTVVIKLNKQNPRFHYVFICGIVGGFEMVPEHIWGKQDPTTFRDNPPVRSGPYKLDRVIPDQLMFIWKKDPNYWNKDVLDPKPEYVVYRTGPVMDSAAEEFKRAQTDLAGLDYPHMKAIQDGGYRNMVIETAFRDPCPRAFWINCDPSKGILADPRMRWAMSYLLDRQKIGQTIWLIPTPPAQYPWADYRSNSRWENPQIANEFKLEYDPRKAAQLLDEMGARPGADGRRMYEGKPVSFEIMTPAIVGNPEYVIAQTVADEFKKLGVEVTVRSYQNPIWTQKWNTGDFDVSSHWLCGVSFDPNQLFTQFQSWRYVPIGQTAVNGNQVRLKDPELDEVTQKLDVADPTAPETKDLMDRALRAYYKALPAIPIIQTTYPAAFNTTYWTGWPTNDNLYHVPLNWWGQFLFVIGNLRPTGAS